jgi:hypothetical protein
MEFERGVEDQLLNTSNILGKNKGSFCVSQGPAIGYPYEMLEINLHACTNIIHWQDKPTQRGAKWHLKPRFSKTLQFVVAFAG